MGNLTIQQRKPDPDIARLAVSKTKSPSKTMEGADKGKKKKKQEEEIVADSWEDEISSSSETEPEKGEETVTTASPGVRSLASKSEGPLAPPQTPTPNTYYNTSPPPTASTSDRSTRAVRPEKQTAVASRMIAGALGIRAPKRTEEQRAYDSAMKEKEIKRRNREKEEEAKARQEEERAKAAVWDT